MAIDHRSRRSSDPRQTAEAAFRAVTRKTPEAAPAAPAPAAIPGARETVSLRIDKAVLEHFQKDGPGWHDRINAALKAAAGL
ncbi:BrnA antitoxin family protein [Methylobacterium sp. Leaf118]|uniref:BrnA antitoxin family protein n=1 Tax=Methylobacterium sp. Leaf118 TaxID=2876562 RepID=UPI001E576D5F|nr:BrnA antitoxin family protein [Methylobacterium sp. Leaf118]